MKNGMYSLQFSTAHDRGVGMLTFEDGVIYGVDEAGVLFDGTYGPVDNGLIEAVIKVTYPPGVQSVFGIANPYQWAIDFSLRLDPKNDHGNIVVKTPTNHTIHVSYRLMRPLPLAA